MAEAWPPEDLLSGGSHSSSPPGFSIPSNPSNFSWRSVTREIRPRGPRRAGPVPWGVSAPAFYELHFSTVKPVCNPMPTSDLNAAEAVPRSSGIQLLPAGSDRPGRDAGIRNTIRLLVANELPLVMSSRPRKRAQGHVRYGLSRIKAPERELGDCDAAHRSDKSQAKRCRLSGVAGGVAFSPAVPGLAPRACMGQGEDARSERPARWHGQPRPVERRLARG